MLKVMVVDDEEDVAALFQQRFRKEVRAGEIEFTFAFSGESALRELEEGKAKDFVLMLSDINMPGMSGLDLLRITKERYSHLKVIMVTAYGNRDYFEKAQQYGSDDYFTKPIDFESLKSRLLSQ